MVSLFFMRLFLTFFLFLFSSLVWGAPAMVWQSMSSVHPSNKGVVVRFQNNKLLVAGVLKDQFFVARYHLPSLVLDNNFGDHGIRFIDCGGVSDLHAMEIDLSGDLFLAGFVRSSQGSLACVAKLSADGKLRNYFGSEGIAKFSLLNNGEIHSLALSKQGVIYLAGYSKQNEASQGFVVRLTSDGVVDTSFANRGWKNFSQTQLYSLAFDSHQQLWSAGGEYKNYHWRGVVVPIEAKPRFKKHYDNNVSQISDLNFLNNHPVVCGFKMISQGSVAVFDQVVVDQKKGWGDCHDVAVRGEEVYWVGEWKSSDQSTGEWYLGEGSDVKKIRQFQNIQENVQENFSLSSVAVNTNYLAVTGFYNQQVWIGLINQL